MIGSKAQVSSNNGIENFNEKIKIATRS
jgi:hypothetical protein